MIQKVVRGEKVPSFLKIVQVSHGIMGAGKIGGEVENEECEKK
jgi:hypothetical protein